MMTTRSTEDLPAEWAGPILDLVEQARISAAPADDENGAWAAAEAGQDQFRTGYKAARRTASAGQLAAHLLRLRAADRVDQGDLNDWTVALAKAGPAISSWDWDIRMQGALDLRRTFLDTTRTATTDARPARLVAAWLTHNAGAQLVPATGRLVEYVLEHEDVSPKALERAWYAVHGARLLDELAARGKPREGRPTREDAAHHTLVRVAVCGVHAAQIMTKRELARRAGTTRMTIDSWLNAAIPAAAAEQAPDGRHLRGVPALSNGVARLAEEEPVADPEES
ncbi:hypothetical protein [Pengzhenrongella sp.]|jgi:hypothetical protein|uniref:hypothetical protein n=1 Tax=Pengzhenrongella sp. TaxID=2888820 RepID=UPI002F955D04